MVQWLPFDWLTRNEIASIFASFASVFKYPTIWYNRHFTYFLMIGADHELEIDYQRLSERMNDEKIAADLRVIHLNEPAEFLYCFGADTAAFKEIASQAERMNTYDNPILEFYKYQEGESIRSQPFAGRMGFPRLKNLGKTAEEERKNAENLKLHLDVANSLILALHCDREREVVERWRYNRAALSLKPTDVAALWAGQLSEQLLQYQLDKRIEATKGNPSPEKFAKLADFYYQMGDLSSAIMTMEKAILAFPDSMELRLQLTNYREMARRS
jgi:hypothetical protein